jgi:signal transduction histidine kinase
MHIMHLRTKLGDIVPAALVVCAALVIGAMTWLTLGTLGTERERAQAEVRADLQERTRLALWRMDSLGAAILLDESTWPETTSRLPVVTRFAYSPGGSLASPDGGPEAEVLKNSLGTGRNAIEALRRIARVPAPLPEVPIEQKRSALQSYNTFQNEDRLQMDNQVAANWAEQSVRSKAVENTLKRAPSKVSSYPPPAAEAKDVPADAMVSEPQAAPASETIVGQPRVAWIEGRLYLARRVSDASNETFFDGAWIDDAALRTMLLNEVADLFVSASLHPANGPSADGMVLASFPYRLVVPPLAVPSFRPSDSTALSLAAAWGAALLALLATSVVVRGVMRLSERRASFVSAVTHELRTPLTTFRLYSDMLESGAVKEEKRGQYLHVLSREADRLSHLVENVLAFSRIERGNARSQVMETETGALLEQCRERLEARLATAGLTLKIETSSTLRVRADTAAVEHILFNLIDNAAKYAANSEPPVVTVEARDAGRFVEIVVADHGPGIPPAERRRIFHAFHKSAREAAETKPGVGLGLALSRRLAKAQGGDLLCDGSGRGASFVLRLPRVA